MREIALELSLECGIIKSLQVFIYFPHRKTCQRKKQSSGLFHIQGRYSSGKRGSNYQQLPCHRTSVFANRKKQILSSFGFRQSLQALRVTIKRTLDPVARSLNTVSCLLEKAVSIHAVAQVHQKKIPPKGYIQDNPFINCKTSTHLQHPTCIDTYGEGEKRKQNYILVCNHGVTYKQHIS